MSTAPQKRKVVAHRAKNHDDADQWDLEFWQNQTPETRLSALTALRNDLAKIHGRNTALDDE